ncbi:DUF2259 domain-containing protein [Bdellovibrio sp. HCB290]|uniref:DUF2259 domain-containing protein n=1 Tax=Bdellovibrio sp. HCB290 TaxID=3394356 RepID=UPI0039B384D4
MKSLSLFVVTLSFVFTANAADQHKFHNLGFSADGKHFAYATSVVQDGSGYGVAEINIKSLQNYDASPVLSVNRMVEEGDARAALKIAMQAVNFAAFNIAPGTIKGETIKATSATEITVENYNAKYRFAMTTKASPFTPDYCHDYPNQALVDIKLTKTDRAGSETSVLFNEDYAPANRICAYNYAIEKVIRNGDRIALVISYNATGFEGPDTDYMIVTTVLE